MRLNEFHSNRSKSFLAAFALALVFLVGFIDYITGPHVSFSIFYLLPIVFAAWFVGKRTGILVSVCCGLIWLYVDLSNADNYPHPVIHYWNASVRLGFFLIVAYGLVALKEAHERLKLSYIRMSQLSGDLAHELRTPITNLAGEAEVALSKERTSNEYREVLESSLEEYGRLSRMIDCLLFLARAENPQMRIERKVFDAHEDVLAVQEVFDAMAQEQNIQVGCTGSAIVNADPMLFRRAVSNVLANAFQHTRDGKINVFLRQFDDGSVEVKVSDTGCGIPSEALPRIFDRFYTVKGNGSVRPGTGLGLAIVKSIMELHGGNIRINSELNKGTTVLLRFPVSS